MKTDQPVKPEAFAPQGFAIEGDGDTYAIGRTANQRGWTLTTYRIPYYGQQLEFVKVDHPDGTSSYFRPDPDVQPAGFCAGPFGGGLSWSVPKYVLVEVQRVLAETFKEDDDSHELSDSEQAAEDATWD